MCKFWLKCTYSRVHMPAPFHDDHLQGGWVWPGQGESRGGCWRRSGRVICAVVTPHAAKRYNVQCMCKQWTWWRGCWCRWRWWRACPPPPPRQPPPHPLHLELLATGQLHQSACWTEVNMQEKIIGSILLSTTLQTRARCQNFTWQLSCAAGPQ